MKGLRWGIPGGMWYHVTNEEGLGTQLPSYGGTSDISVGEAESPSLPQPNAGILFLESLSHRDSTLRAQSSTKDRLPS